MWNEEIIFNHDEVVFSHGDLQSRHSYIEQLRDEFGSEESAAATLKERKQHIAAMIERLENERSEIDKMLSDDVFMNAIESAYWHNEEQE